MKRLVIASIFALAGVSTVAFAEELSHASDGRLSIESPGATVRQDVTENGHRYAETFVVQPNHTLKLVDRVSL
ncbi:hypothetical protein [Rhizobium oryzicola]|uniref:Uncharacterized protein n=1 Tax=Rhizobium oryzicola TaxID=1232668 RepID=A0ABT8T190_9HYPH|nr:hypothetical protein [Rhizobium oryzicola]MDO1584412.1 hypothetical protein [Rhizobium oryzicola]